MRFRDARNKWYFDRTGKHLSGTLQEQKYQFDLIARNFRSLRGRSYEQRARDVAERCAFEAFRRALQAEMEGEVEDVHAPEIASPTFERHGAC